MQIFFVSIRTALIYGPGQLLEARATGANHMLLRMSWPNSYAFDEWEGYAVVAPENDEVWGLSHPAQAIDGEIEIEFPYTPQPIPPKDRKLFPGKAGSEAAQNPAPAQGGKPAAKAKASQAQPEADEEEWVFYRDDETSFSA